MRADGVQSFWNLPYARSPVAERRFAPPEPHPGWSGVRDATVPGPSVPQAESRLAGVMGAAPGHQDEHDSLTVNVFAPVDPGPYPVLVWIHGGGFSSGSGGWPWYEGRRLAEEQQVVVVTLNYRLGALGFLYLAELVEGLGEGNFGLLDQVAALRWVRDNIGAFGGNPDRIVLGGQSAGALSVGALASNPAVRPLVSGAIMQSPPNSTMVQTREGATRRAQALLDELGIEASGAREVLRRIPAQAFVGAAVEIARRTARFGDFDPVFAPTEDDRLGLVAAAGGAVRSGTADGVPLLIGCTARETTAFLHQRPGFAELGRDEVESWFDSVLGPQAERALRDYDRAHPGLGPAELLVVATTDRSFAVETLRIASDRGCRGAATWVYRFDWEPRETSFGACHCIELPFLFGTFDAFSKAPMLGGEDPPLHLAAEFQALIGSFVRTGVPDTAGGAVWPGYERSSEILHLGGDPRLERRDLGEPEAHWL
jgi:para-nitrobenzyl esterase